MAAFFLDFDGTLVKFHTGEWLPGAVELLGLLHEKGHQIFITTMRGARDHDTEWSRANTERMLAALPFPVEALYGVDSPRFLIDDGPIAAQPTPTDDPSWIATLIEKLTA